MTTEPELSFYLGLIKKAHISFYDYISHLPQEALDWKIMKLLPNARWLVTHIIKDQQWFAEVICSDTQEPKEYQFYEEYPNLSLEELIHKYSEVITKIEKSFEKCLKEKTLNTILSYKGYKLTLEEALFEYIHHLILHEGQIAQIITAWKRKQRTLSSSVGKNEPLN